MYMIWIFIEYMYIRIVGYTERKYISIDNNIDIDISIDNIDWMVCGKVYQAEGKSLVK